MSNAELANAQGFSVRLASTQAEVVETQRLRYDVFAREMGAQVREEKEGIESDRYDAYCDHLFVEELITLVMQSKSVEFGRKLFESKLCEGRPRRRAICITTFADR